MNAWQPIKTYRRGAVLAYFRNHEPGLQIMIAHADEGTWYAEETLDDLTEIPSHWMPLPDPPESSK